MAENFFTDMVWEMRTRRNKGSLPGSGIDRTREVTPRRTKEVILAGCVCFWDNVLTGDVLTERARSVLPYYRQNIKNEKRRNRILKLFYHCREKQAKQITGWGKLEILNSKREIDTSVHCQIVECSCNFASVI